MKTNKFISLRQIKNWTGRSHDERYNDHQIS